MQSVPTAKRKTWATSKPKRQPGVGRFYNKRVWRDKVRAIKLGRVPYCEICFESGLLVDASHVHHVKEVREHPESSLDITNMQSLCASCHSRLHKRNASKRGDAS